MNKNKSINEQIEKEVMIDYKKINTIAKLANKYSNVLTYNNKSNKYHYIENFNIIMNFYFKIFKYLSPSVIHRLKENYNWTLLYSKTHISLEAANLINYSIIIHESNLTQFLKHFGYNEEVRLDEL